LSQELREALEAEHVVLSGGNAKKLKHLPANIISGSNQNAFLGGRGERASVEVMELGFAETQYQEVFRQPRAVPLASWLGLYRKRPHTRHHHL
jgi:hypothetical protein